MDVKPKRKPLLGWWTAPFDAVAAVAVFFLVGALLGTWRDASFQSSGEPPVGATSAEIWRYWVITAALFALLVLGFVVALSQQRTAAVIAYPLVGVLALAIVLVFAVPRIDWNQGGGPYPVNPHACTRTDSENCPGG